MAIEPGTAEWLSRLTASRFHRLFGGMGSWESLRREMTTAPAEGQGRGGGWQTEHGKENESRARALYELETGRETMVPEHKKLAREPRIGATVDFLTSCGIVGEIKCPVDVGRHMMHHQGVFDEAYFWQMQGGMWLWGADEAHFVSFSEAVPATIGLTITVVPRCDQSIRKLEEYSLAFLDWFDNSEASVPFDFLTPGAADAPKLF